MEEKFFDADFDFEAYIQDRLLEIEDVGDRTVMKQLMERVMVPFYRHTEAQYQALVKRARDEMLRERAFCQECDVVTAIAKRQYVDGTDGFLFPMCAEDLTQDNLSEPRIYLRADRESIGRLKKERRVFRGRICSAYGAYEATFALSPVDSYTRRLQWLYNVFVQNGQPWKSVCAPHLDRFFDVRRVSGELPEGEELTAVYVNLEEYADAVLYDYIPLWNIEVTREKSSAYPQLAIDQIQYVHGIYSTRLQPEREYLVAHEDISVWKTERTPDGLAITCDSPDPVLWNLVAFCKSGKRDGEKDLYSNAGARRLWERCPRTEGEVRRSVPGLGYGDRLILTDVVPVEGSYAGSGRTYSMDSFIEDALCHAAPEQKLLFRFRSRDGSDYLNYDILSYLLSRIQWELPQFLCIGEVV